MRCLLPLCAAAVLTAADARSATASSSAAALPPDTSSAVVAEGRYRYLARDVDALVLIARRHAKQRLNASQEDVLRQVLLRALPAREALVAALDGLPLEGTARDSLVLDLLAWQAEPMPAPASAAARSASPAAAAGPVIVSLPPLPVERSIAGQHRSLQIGLALLFPDQASAERWASQAPLLQDALLGAAQALPDAQILAPLQAEIRQAFSAAIRARLPDFPVDGMLVPRLEVGE